MQIRSLRHTILFLAIVISFFVARPLTAAESGAIRGTITDPLGAVIRNAQVELFQGGERAATTSTDQVGAFEFTSLAAGRYHIRAEARQLLHQVLWAATNGNRARRRVPQDDRRNESEMTSFVRCQSSVVDCY